MLIVIIVVVGVLALFWGAMSDAVKLWAVCLCAAGALFLSVQYMRDSLTPQQRHELEVRQQDQKLIDDAIAARK